MPKLFGMFMHQSLILATFQTRNFFPAKMQTSVSKTKLALIITTFSQELQNANLFAYLFISQIGLMRIIFGPAGKKVNLETKSMQV